MAPSGILYVVGTPIGNLDDISLRAIRVLEEVDLVACEDTRTTRKLLSKFGVDKRTVPFFQHSRRRELTRLLDALAEGRNVAYVTEAGTPGISDPGAELVRACLDRGMRVVPIPGASALVAAISVSGLVAGPFVFEGFLPMRPSKRRRRLREMAHDHRPIVFYESPHRLIESLEDLIAIFGDRPAVIARELTKIYEEIRRGTLSELLAHYRAQGPRGEFTLVVGTPR